MVESETSFCSHPLQVAAVSCQSCLTDPENPYFEYSEEEEYDGEIRAGLQYDLGFPGGICVIPGAP
jgi:hypothetical protein